MSESRAGLARRPLVIAAVAAVVVLVVAGVALWWTQGDGEHASDSPTPSSTGPAATPSTTAATTTSTPSPVEPVLEDGRHPVYLTGLDVEGRSVEFDLIRFLTGDEAFVAYQQEHPDFPEGMTGDYYIVNDNPRLRTLPVAGAVQVTVVENSESAADADTVAFEALPAYVSTGPMPRDEGMWPNPFWLTVSDGTIVAIEEQFLP